MGCEESEQERTEETETIPARRRSVCSVLSVGLSRFASGMIFNGSADHVIGKSRRLGKQRMRSLETMGGNKVDGENRSSTTAISLLSSFPPVPSFLEFSIHGLNRGSYF
jgi:hypothetical protein